MFTKIIFFIWLFAITFTSLVDYSSINWLNLPKNMDTGTSSGYVFHFIGYFIAAALCFLAFKKKRQRVILITLTALFLLGVLFEIVQIHIPHRSFNPKDIAANGLGLAGFHICFIIYNKIEELN